MDFVLDIKASLLQGLKHRFSLGIDFLKIGLIFEKEYDEHVYLLLVAVKKSNEFV